jgi:hypothetical protein
MPGLFRLAAASTDAAVIVEVAAEVGFERFKQAQLDLLHFAELAFEVSHPLFERLGAFALIRDLALLDEVPEKSHGCASAVD